jgi:membrane-associated phospholipid phosphatase
VDSQLKIALKSPCLQFNKISLLTASYFYRFIPNDWRMPISVEALPAAERAIFGTSVSTVLSAYKSVLLDVLAWLPYGIFHFGAPVVCSILIFIFAAPGTLPVYAKTFGYMNLIGVLIQTTFPCAPPWYENHYGNKPAYYGMGGDPAGLARIDELFGVDMYTTTFLNQPIPFGAFPSLHSGCATTEALFLSHVFPRGRIIFALYVVWIWWATMYLQHHYAVDLIGGFVRKLIPFESKSFPILTNIFYSCSLLLPLC